MLNFIKNNLQILNIHGCDFLHQIYMEYNSFFTKSGLESVTKLNWNPNFVPILDYFVLFWLILVDQNQKNLNFVLFWWTKIKKILILFRFGRPKSNWWINFVLFCFILFRIWRCLIFYTNFSTFFWILIWKFLTHLWAVAYFFT